MSNKRKVKLTEVFKKVLREAKCPQCGSDGAYVGLNDVECKNSDCSNFKGGDTGGDAADVAKNYNWAVVLLSNYSSYTSKRVWISKKQKLEDVVEDEIGYDISNIFASKKRPGYVFLFDVDGGNSQGVGFDLKHNKGYEAFEEFFMRHANRDPLPSKFIEDEWPEELPTPSGK